MTQTVGPGLPGLQYARQSVCQKGSIACTSYSQRSILAMFEREFRLSERDAVSLLTSSVHLLGTGEALRENLR